MTLSRATLYAMSDEHVLLFLLFCYLLSQLICSNVNDRSVDRFLAGRAVMY